MKAIYKRYIIWSKSIVDIKVSNTEKSKNNLEKRMKVGPLTLYAVTNENTKIDWLIKSYHNNYG